MHHDFSFCRPFHKLPVPKVAAVHTGTRGWGITAEEFIPSGAFVVEYTGVLLWCTCKHKSISAQKHQCCSMTCFISTAVALAAFLGLRGSAPSQIRCDTLAANDLRRREDSWLTCRRADKQDREAKEAGGTGKTRDPGFLHDGALTWHHHRRTCEGQSGKAHQQQL